MAMPVQPSCPSPSEKDLKPSETSDTEDPWERIWKEVVKEGNWEMIFKFTAFLVQYGGGWGEGGRVQTADGSHLHMGR